jgi:sugar phosphate isomerase/epimerase
MTRFGLSTHLFHHDRLDRRHIDLLASRGFDLIEVFATRTHVDYHDDGQIRQLAGWLKDAGVEAGSMHAPIASGLSAGVWGTPYSTAAASAGSRQAALAEIRRSLDAAQSLGCGTLVVHLGVPDVSPDSRGNNDVAAMRRSVESLVDAAAGATVRLAFEVIPNGLSSPAALVELLDGDLDVGASGVCLDFGHAHMGAGTAEAAEMLSGHIITTHVHDNRGHEDSHLVPFAGSIDWPATAMAMAKIGDAGPWVFEVADHGDAMGVLDRTVGARARLQGILNDLAQPFAFSE